VAVDRTTNSATGPQKTFKPRRRFLGRHGLGSRLQQLKHKIYPVTGRGCFEPGDLRLQCQDLCRRRSDVACLTTTSWPPRMPYFREIHVHQYFAIIRQ
jgi:hypothetical protein